MPPETTYDRLVRRWVRVIISCELERARLHAESMALAVEELVTLIVDPEAAEQIEALRRAIQQQISDLRRLEDNARSLLAALRRDHGQIRRARGASPDGGAERHYYTGVS